MEHGKVGEIPDPTLARKAAALLRSQLCNRGVAICLSGIDGSGKTTLALELFRVLKASGVPVRYLHLHQWYLNVSFAPVLLLYNRYFGCKVLLFDRSIYDNIAVVSSRRYWLRSLSRVALKVVLACYPRFHYRLYLMVSFTETTLRRPDTDEKRFIVLTQVYDEIAFRARYIRLRSDIHLFATVLRKIAGEA